MRDLLAACHRRLGPLGPLLLAAGALLILASGFRLLHTLLYIDRVAQVDGAGWLPLVALRMDLVLVCMALSLPTLLLLAVPAAWWRRHPAPLAVLFTIPAALIVWMELATVPFMREFDARPNRIFLEYLANPREVLSTVLSTAPLMTVVAIVATALAAWGLFRLFRRSVAATSEWRWWVRAAVFPLIGGLFFYCIRGTGHHPINPSSAAFSGDALTNQLALNSVYSVAYAAYATKNEGDPAKFYGEMPAAEIYARVARVSGQAPWSATAPIPALRAYAPRPGVERPRNLVILLQESLGAEFVGCLGGKPLTPHIDRLAEEGMLLTNLYCTGTRTVRGIEAVWSGFLPTPGRSVVKLPKSQQGFFTIADLLGRHGYNTMFVYGGEKHFDSMGTFFVGNGVKEVWDEKTFKDPEFHGIWGVSDEDLFRQADRIFTEQTGPFCALVLSTSNHQPFEFPAGTFELYEQPQATVHNAMKYADHSVGSFFAAAKQRPWYQDTVFLIVADHNTRTYGDDLVPVNKFHIPGLIIGPGVPAQRFDRIASQVDLIPTLLPFLGVRGEAPLLGRDLLALPEGDPGRAIMQFETIHGYMVGDRVVVQQPELDPQAFRYQGGRLVADPQPDPELIRDALAHALLPGLMYKRGQHRLP
jgi:phosphoglycerol transferase MdoB-like AlkP superfamily enzyme